MSETIKEQIELEEKIDENTNENVDEKNVVVDEEEKQYIVVNIGDEFFGIDIMHIDNIVRMQRITRVPKTEKYFKGVINLRGEVVPVMSLRCKFGIEEEAITNASRIIIVKIDGQYPVGILVDAVKEVISIAESKIEKSVQGVASDKVMYLNGIGKYNNELVSLLNIDSVLGVKES